MMNEYNSKKKPLPTHENSFPVGRLNNIAEQTVCNVYFDWNVSIFRDIFFLLVRLLHHF